MAFDKRSRNDMLLARVKEAPISEIVGAFVDLKNKGRGRYVCCCPFHEERTPSCWIDDSRGNFKCFGCDAHGDALEFIMRIERCGFIDAVERAVGILRIDGGSYQPSRIRRVQETNESQIRKSQSEAEKVRDIWRRSIEITGTLGEVYFRDVRKIRIHRLPEGRLPVSIKFIPAHEYWHTRAGGRTVLMGRYPAIISAMQNADDVITAVHQIYLDAHGNKLRLTDPDGGDKPLPAKKMRGPAWASAIRLGYRAAHMGASEGIENGLVYMAEAGRVVWAAASLNNLAGPGLGEGLPRPDAPDRRLPPVFPDISKPAFTLPPECKSVDIIKDSDGKDQLAADCLFERCGRRHAVLGKDVSYIVPPAGLDLNDVIIGGAA